MTQQHGRKYENALANELDDITTNDVWVGCTGYSGNSKRGASDIVATVSPEFVTRGMAGQYNIEAKKVQGDAGKRTNVFRGSSSGESGLGELQRFVECTPSFVDPVLAIKFDHRELVVLDARHVLYRLGDEDRGILPPDSLNVHGARLTPSDNVSMRKPELSDWESSTAGDDDAVVLAEKLSLPYEVNNSE